MNDRSLSKGKGARLLLPQIVKSDRVLRHNGLIFAVWMVGIKRVLRRQPFVDGFVILGEDIAVPVIVMRDQGAVDVIL